MSEMMIVRESGENVATLSVLHGETILGVLQREGLEMPDICGIHGVCGKCRIRMLDGAVMPSMIDTQLFTAEEIESGVRLACMARPMEDCVVQLTFIDDELKRQQAESMENAGETRTEKTSMITNENVQRGEKNYAVAIDLGTTTIGMQLIDTNQGKVLHSCGALNPQRKYGADVISRIKADANGLGDELKHSVKEVIRENLVKLAEAESISPGELRGIYLAGNTTMLHILLGYACDSLGQYPFKPVTLSRQRFISKELFYLPIVILPGISAFVGADIVAGLYEMGFGEEDEINMLIDLGTNGELALGNRERILCTATAAGPAFEGKFGLDMKGSDLISVVADLLDEGIIDHTGLLQEPYFEKGYEVNGELLRQADIRDLQVAKAATCVGIQSLVKEYRISYDDISHIYLAGGFGHYLNVEKAIRIGLFPKELNDRIVAVGNTSLQGTVRYACHDEEPIKELEMIRNVTKEFNLALQKDFGDDYVAALTFPKPKEP